MSHKRPYSHRQPRTPRGALSTMRPHRRARRGTRVIIALVMLVVVALAVAWGLSSWHAGSGSETGDATSGTNSVPTSASTSDTISATGPPENIRLAYPTYLGGPQRCSSGSGPAPASLGLVWKVEIGSGLTARKSDNKLVTWAGTGWTGQPTVTCVEDRTVLAIGGYDHGLRTIDAVTGEVIWRAALDDVIKGTNTVYYDPSRPAGDRLVVVTGSRRGNQYDVGDEGIAPLRAFSFATGKELWRLPVTRSDNYSQDVDASPLWVDGRLVVAIEPGYVLALDTSRLKSTSDGHLQPTVVASSPALYSQKDVTEHAESGGSNLALEGSPAVWGNRIYIASSSGHVYGLNRKTLAVEWDFNPGGDFDSTVVVTPEGKLLVGLERQYVDHGGVFMLDPARPADDCVVWFFSTQDRGVGEWDGGVIGSVAIGHDPSGAPIAAFLSPDGNLYVVSRDAVAGTSPSLDGTGTYPRPKLLFSDSVGGSISTPAIVGNRIVAAGLDKTVHLYEMTAGATGPAFREVDTFVADGFFESTPLVWNGRVYIGCRDGYLYCLGDV